MNTIGKILVILNLVFALVVGGFLVVDFATRTNWKKAYDDLSAEMKVAGVNTTVSGDTLTDLNKQVKQALADLAAEKQKLVDFQQLAKAKEESLQLMGLEKDQAAKDADLNYQKALGEKERLKDEVKNLAATIASREKTILAMQDDNKRLRTEAIANENIAKSMQERNENLLGQLQDMTRKLARLETGGGESPVGRDPSAANPPTTFVKGRIGKVGGDKKDLVEITVGSDHGLAKHHTLEVYRLSPRPEYLGMIRIVDVTPHGAVARLVRTRVGGPKTLQEGDIVASSLSNNP
ncbi:MAG: hypothetical protein L0Y72_08585 [Gemmataceae bacterium]|nr:hypothetical protein [Gemmataceae bacterium]MCI0739087.1 hypothetical protein [Gemmataceae bacterium]